MTKTAREWFEELPSPIREMAIANATLGNLDVHYEYLSDAIDASINWDETPQGYSFGREVYAYAYDEALELLCISQEPHPQKHIPHRHKYSPIKFS